MPNGKEELKVEAHNASDQKQPMWQSIHSLEITAQQADQTYANILDNIKIQNHKVILEQTKQTGKGNKTKTEAGLKAEKAAMTIIARAKGYLARKELALKKSQDSKKCKIVGKMATQEGNNYYLLALW